MEERCEHASRRSGSGATLAWLTSNWCCPGHQSLARECLQCCREHAAPAATSVRTEGVCTARGATRPGAACACCRAPTMRWWPAGVKVRHGSSCGSAAGGLQGGLRASGGGWRQGSGGGPPPPQRTCQEGGILAQQSPDSRMPPQRRPAAWERHEGGVNMHGQLRCYTASSPITDSACTPTHPPAAGGRDGRAGLHISAALCSAAAGGSTDEAKDGVGGRRRVWWGESCGRGPKEGSCPPHTTRADTG